MSKTTEILEQIETLSFARRDFAKMLKKMKVKRKNFSRALNKLWIEIIEHGIIDKEGNLQQRADLNKDLENLTLHLTPKEKNQKKLQEVLHGLIEEKREQLG